MNDDMRRRVAQHTGGRDYLLASDFTGGTVVVQWEDGSHARFEYAFALWDEPTQSHMVFTEHCGYFHLCRGAECFTEKSDP